MLDFSVEFLGREDGTGQGWMEPVLPGELIRFTYLSVLPWPVPKRK